MYQYFIRSEQLRKYFHANTWNILRETNFRAADFFNGKKIPQSNMSEKQIIIFWSEQTSCNLGMLQVNLPPPLPFNFSNGQWS